jgi:hypothetical protein
MKVHCLLVIAFLLVLIQQSLCLDPAKEDSLRKEIELLKKHKDEAYQNYLNVWNQLDEAKNDVKDDLKQSYQNSNNQYQQSRDKFLAQVKQALETTKNKYHEEREQLRKAIQDLKTYKDQKKGDAQDVYEQTKEQLLKPIHASQEKYTATKNQLQKYYNQIYNELYSDYEKAKQLASSAKNDYARTEARTVYNSAKANLRYAYDNIVEFGQSSLDTARDLIETLKDYSQYYTQKVADKTKETAPEILQTVKDTANNLADKTQQTAPEVVQSVKDTANNYYSILEQDYEAAKVQAADFLQRAKEWLSEDDNTHQDDVHVHVHHDAAHTHVHHDDL